MSDTETRLAALEAKVRVLEDTLELRDIMDRYGPAVDSGDADAAAELFADDSVYDAEGAPPMLGGDGAHIAHTQRVERHRFEIQGCVTPSFKT